MVSGGAASRDEMTAPVFLLRPLPDASRLTLDGAEGRHAATVRRLRVGERVDVTDGTGNLAECVVVSAARDHLELDVQQRTFTPEASPRVVVVQALVKGDRSELAVELLTEIGVDEIVPWAAERCVATWVPDKSPRRWGQAAAEASKQARRSRWPIVGELASLAAVEDRVRAASQAYLLHEGASQALTALLSTGAPDGEVLVADVLIPEVLIIVGPEGGVSDREIGALSAAGAEPVRLGPSVLRSSTAGCAAASVVLAARGRWS